MRSLSEKRSETRKISHNPEVVGSNPTPATYKDLATCQVFLFGGRWPRRGMNSNLTPATYKDLVQHARSFCLEVVGPVEG